MVVAATVALLAGGAGAFALARTSDTPPAVAQPYGPDAPFGVGYVDGFGEHSPSPAVRPASRKPRPARSSSAAASPAGPSPLDSPNILVESGLSAVQWSRVGNGRFDTFLWVHNDSPASASWEVQVRLSDGAKLTGSSAVNRTYVDGVWVFTSTKGSLGAGLVYLFSFSGTTGASRFSLRSCTVNGSPCEPFN